MTKKFSSFKEQQVLVENWRKFAHPQPTQLEEEIMEILNQVNEGDLNEGALEVMGWVAKKLKFDRLALIAAMTGALAPSTANAGILDDINKFGVNVKNQIVHVAKEAREDLRQKGIEIDQDGKAVKSTKKAKKTLEDFVKEQVKGVKTIKKVFEEETGNGLGIVYETNQGLVAIAPMDKEVYGMSASTEQSSADMAAKSLLAQYITQDKSSETTTSGDTTTTTTTSKYDGDLGTKNQGQFFTAGDNQFINWTKGEGYMVVSMPSVSK